MGNDFNQPLVATASLRVLAAILLCSFALPGCDRTYFADPITATVVDSETKRPLEGVVVAAHWEMKGGLEGGNVGAEVMIMEAVTDSAGKFHFPGWGPLKVHVGFLSNAKLTNATPEMIFFKGGYEWGMKANFPTTKTMNGVGPHLFSEWNGKTIELKKFEGTLKEYAREVDDGLPRYAFEGHCNWRKIPAMILAIRDQTKIFQNAGIHTGTFYTSLLINDGFGCGPVEQYLKEHGQRN